MARNPFPWFRRALSRQDKEAFDRLMERASKHQAGKMKIHRVGELEICSIDPVDAIILSILLEHEKEIIELRYRLTKKLSSESFKNNLEADTDG